MVAVMQTSTEQVPDYIAALPRKRSAAGVLFFDGDGRVLLVEPTYKDYWEIPGGAVEQDESPSAAGAREVQEELGLTRTPGRLLALDWVPPRPQRTEGLICIFDGGELSPADTEQITLDPTELRTWAFVTGTEAVSLLSPLLGRRLLASLDARAAGTTAYLEDGSPL